MEEALELQARRAGEPPATDHRPEDFLHPPATGPGSESDEPKAPPPDDMARTHTFSAAVLCSLVPRESVHLFTS